MGFFKKLKSLFSGYSYKINREILERYINEVIDFAKVNNFSFCDEFFLKIDSDSENALHVMILNYDVPCDDQLECEKDLHGVIIFVNEKKMYNPETDRKYYNAAELIRSELGAFPQWIVLENPNGAPTSLEKYKIS